MLWANLINGQNFKNILIYVSECLHVYTSPLLSISATKFPEVLSRAIRGVALTNYNWICILKKNQSYRAWLFLGVGVVVKSFMQRSNLRKVADSTEEYLNKFRRPFPVLSRIINYWKERNIWDSCTLYYLNYGSLNSTSFTLKISIPAAFVAFAVE